MATSMALMHFDTAQELGINSSEELNAWLQDNSDDELWDPDWVVTVFAADFSELRTSYAEIHEIEVLACKAEAFSEDWVSSDCISSYFTS